MVIVNNGRGIGTRMRSMDGAIFNDLEWLSEASCSLFATAELLVAKHLSYIGHAHELFSVIDNIIVDVFKIICCSEPTDSFVVNVTVAQLPGHSRGTRFYSWGTCPGCPFPIGAATDCPRTREFPRSGQLLCITVGVIWQLKMVQLVQSQGMLFTTKHVMYQVKVCFRDLLVCWHFPAPSVHQYVNSHYTSRE